MKLLLVEDEDPKRDAVLDLVRRDFAFDEIDTARSVRSAIGRLRRQLPNLLLLDMSLPTFDIAPGEPGGRPQGSGGIEVMRFIETLDSPPPTIVVTGYDVFSKRSGQRIGYTALRDELDKDFPAFFRGLVHFDPIQGAWSDDLRSAVQLALGGAQR